MSTTIVNALLASGQSVQSGSVALNAATSVSVSCAPNVRNLGSVAARLMFLVSANEWIEGGTILLTPTAPSGTFTLANYDPQALARVTTSTFTAGNPGLVSPGKSNKGARSSPSTAPQATWSILFDSVLYLLQGGPAGASVPVSATYQ